MQHPHDLLVRARVSACIDHHHDVVCFNDFLNHGVAGNRDFRGVDSARERRVGGLAGMQQNRHEPRLKPIHPQPAMGIAQHLRRRRPHRIQDVGQGPGTLQSLAQLQQGLGMGRRFGRGREVAHALVYPMVSQKPLYRGEWLMIVNTYAARAQGCGHSSHPRESLQRGAVPNALSAVKHSYTSEMQRRNVPRCRPSLRAGTGMRRLLCRTACQNFTIGCRIHPYAGAAGGRNE